LISWKSEPGGGTTDYAVDIFYEALKTGKYTSFLKADTGLPMMYMEDAIRGTIELVEAPAEKVKIRSSYNFSSLSFTPEVLAQAIQKEMPDFSIDYNPDFRQAIAETWPESIDDHFAREHWGWKHNYDLNDMVKDMLKNLRTKLNIK
jgi:nucleoside-diphosphate-sugar epimerase